MNDTAITLARRNFARAAEAYRIAPAIEKRRAKQQLNRARWHLEQAERVVIRAAMPYGRNGRPTRSTRASNLLARQMKRRLIKLLKRRLYLLVCEELGI